MSYIVYICVVIHANEWVLVLHKATYTLITAIHCMCI